MTEDRHTSNNPYQVPVSTDECGYAEDLAHPELGAEVVRLAEFRHNLTAELAWNFLRQHGIDVQIAGGGVSTALNYYGTAVQLTELYVKSCELDAAAKLLKEFQQELLRNKSNRQPAGWICDRCGEKNVNSFELCWNCTAERDPNQQHDFAVGPQDPDDDIFFLDTHRATAAAQPPEIPPRFVLSGRWLIPVTGLILAFVVLWNLVRG